MVLFGDLVQQTPPGRVCHSMLLVVCRSLLATVFGFVWFAFHAYRFGPYCSLRTCKCFLAQ